MKIRFFITSTFLFVCFGFSMASISDTTLNLANKMLAYAEEHPTTNLFVHTDKNIYSPTERIWLKAYILSGTITDNKVLYVRLVDEKKNIVLKAQFPVYELLSHGDIYIPDTLRDGRYNLYAYADRMINFDHEDVFVQPITIHKNKKKWRAEAYVTDTSKLVRGEKVELLVRLKQNNDLVKNVEGRYQLLNGSKVIKQGGLKTNLVGECYIAFTYPQITDTQRIQAVITFEDESDHEQINLNLPHRDNKLNVNYRPKQGPLIENIQNNIPLHVLDVNNQPVITSVKLLAGNDVVQATTTDSNGLAIISFTPHVDKKYQLALDNKGKTELFPFSHTVNEKGCALTVQPNNNICHITISNTGLKDSAVVVLRLFDEVLWSVPFQFEANRPINFNIALDSFPKRAMSVAVINYNESVLAEQLFMPTITNDVKLEIKTDKKVYGTREKVTVSISALHKNGVGEVANLSVATVEQNTIDNSILPNILNAYSFKGVDGLPQLTNNYNLDYGNINRFLQACNWGKYNWPNVLPYSYKGSITILHNTAGIHGKISSVNKKKFGLKELPILSNAIIESTPVNELGEIDISYKDLIVASNDSKKLILGGKFGDDFILVLKNYEKKFDKALKQESYLDLPTTYAKLSRYQFERLEKLASHQLQNVVVKHTNELAYKIRDYIDTACKDYVCLYNFFNCPIHPVGGTRPVIGATYHLSGGGIIIYRGCGDDPPITQPVYVLKRIEIPTNFNAIDFSKDTTNEPDTRTTIYWNPNIFTDKDGRATFSFFTNDVTGNFEMIVQGVTLEEMKPVYGSIRFTVQ